MIIKLDLSVFYFLSEKQRSGPGWSDKLIQAFTIYTKSHTHIWNNSYSFPCGWRFPGGQRIWAILLNQNQILQERDLISWHRIRVELLRLLNQSLTRSNMISEQSVCVYVCMCNCVFKWQCTSWVLIFPKGQTRAAVREVEWWREGGRFKLPSEMFQRDA